MKDFSEFLCLVNPKLITDEARKQANEKYDSEFEHGGNPNQGNVDEYKVVYIVAGLLEQYHDWLNKAQ